MAKEHKEYYNLYYIMSKTRNCIDKYLQRFNVTLETCEK